MKTEKIIVFWENILIYIDYIFMGVLSDIVDLFDPHNLCVRLVP